MSEHTLAELRLPISPAPNFEPGDPEGVKGTTAAGMSRNSHHLSVPRSPLMQLQVSLSTRHSTGRAFVHGHVDGLG